MNNLQKSILLFSLTTVCGTVLSQTTDKMVPYQFYTSIQQLQNAGKAGFAIVDNNGALYVQTEQNVTYASYSTAFASNNAVTKFYIDGQTTVNNSYVQNNTCYLLRTKSANSGDDYTIFNISPSYLNSQPDVNGVIFVLGTRGNNYDHNYGHDMEYGAAWELNYVAGNGWTIRCAGNGCYIVRDNDNKILNGTTPYYWQFCTLAESNQTLDEGYYNISLVQSYGQTHYLNVSNNNYQNGKPYLNASTSQDLWRLVKCNYGQYYNIVHVSDGKYVVTNADGKSNTEHAVHLESGTPGDNAEFSIILNGNNQYNIIPKGGSLSFNAWNGPGGDIGYYDKDWEGSKWVFTVLSQDMPLISDNSVIYAYRIQNRANSGNFYFVSESGNNGARIKTSNQNDRTSNNAYWYFVSNGNGGYRIWQLTSGYGVTYPNMDTNADVTNGNNDQSRHQITLSDSPSSFKLQNNNILHSVNYQGSNRTWELEPDGGNGQNGNLLNFYNLSDDDKCRWNYVDMTAIPLTEYFTAFSISGNDEISQTGKSQYTHSETKYAEFFQFTLNNQTYYKVGDAAATTTRPTGSSQGITYTWKLSDNANGHATVNSSGVVSYSSYFSQDTQVTLTLTASHGNGSMQTTEKVITMKAPKVNPTGISITSDSPMTVYVGQTGKISYSLTPNPCYDNVTYTSANTGIVTVSADGTVTGVATGSTTVTLTANRINGAAGAPTASVTINVRNKVAAPEIAFTPTLADQGGTATATITCATPGAVIYFSTDGSEPVTDAQHRYYGPIVNVAESSTVKAIAVMPDTQSDYTWWDNSDAVSIVYNRAKVPTPIINVRGYEVSFSCSEPGVTYYYTTDGSTPSTGSSQWNGSPFTSAANTTIRVMAVKNGFSPSEMASKKLGTAHIVYLDFSNGNDSNDGTTTAKAKKTWTGAYSVLGFGPNAKYLRSQWAAHGLTALSNHTAFNGLTDTDFTNTVENNIIYLVGEVSSTNFNGLNQVGENPTSEQNMMNTVIGSGLFKPATISGKYGNLTDASGSKYVRINLSEGGHTLNEDTRFEYIEFYGDCNGNSTDFLLGYYDLEMGEHITMKHFTSTKDFNTYHHGYAQGVTNTAHILYYGGYARDGRFGNGTDGILNFDYYLPHPEGYRITFRSGYFSTISPGSTQWNSGTINGAMGSPNTPVKCTILVDIDRKWNDDHANGVLGNTGNGNPNCDLAVLMAGTHEGNMYGDVDIIVKSGRIDRIVNGTFGANYFVANHPADSYFGRANILIDPREPSTEEKATYPNKNSMVTVRELYGGGLGRFKSDSDKSNQSSTYFYGKSTVTINGGTFLSAIYASGAGGVNGVGDANHHTPDTKLPYMNGSSIAYGDYNAYSSHNKLEIKFHKSRNVYEPDFHTDDKTIESSLTIDQTSAKVEIHGGVFGSSSSPIEGIFGGGYGFVDTELINYQGGNGAKPNTRAGSIFAAAGQTASSLLIDGDAEIYGNIYGAGRGSDTYRKANISFNSDKYVNLGQIYGNVELTIGGNAVIHGNVYGAGQGIEGNDYVNMARLFGNTTVTIGGNAFVSDGVCGGGQNGSMDGNVSLSVLDNATIGTSDRTVNVHGGGYGQITRVNGNVEVTLGSGSDSPVIYGDVYGGSAMGHVNGETASKSYHTYLTLKSGTVNGSLYGGGLGNASTPANVYGQVNVLVYGGKVSGKVFGCNNVNGAPQQFVKVEVNGASADLTDVYGGGNQAPYSCMDQRSPHVNIYDGHIRGSVFGGGLGSTAVVTGTPQMKIGDNTEGATWTVQIDGNVFGGGDAANVTGSTYLFIYNCGTGIGTITNGQWNTSTGSVFGGGNAASLTGNSYVSVYGGSIYRVFGGGNGTTAAANVTGTTFVGIYGGTIKEIYGGSNSDGTIGGKITVNVAEQAAAPNTAICPVQVSNLYGGGNVAKCHDIEVNIGKCTQIDSIFGGANKADVEGNITLKVTDGHIDNLFGGNNNSGQVKGNITVNVDWANGVTAENARLGNVYGGGNIASVDNGTSRTVTVNMQSATTSGSVFGGGKGNTAVIVGSTNVNIGNWTSTSDVIVNGDVFGGGDLAAVEGPCNITLRDCDTYIDGDLYGGGNAAPVYSTNTTIWGGTVAGNVFGGGNGKDLTLNENGAQVGYKRDDVTKIDKSLASAVTNIHGGTVGVWNTAADGEEVCISGGSIYGGSNTKGNIVGNIELNLNAQKEMVNGVEYGCQIKNNEIYGAGNEAAYMGDGEIKLDLGCIDRMSEIYGGSKKADMYGDIHLIVSSGHFNKVFAGNNLGGCIYGSLKVSVDETGCNPVIIDELYGGGNQAAYSVYGYNSDRTVRTSGEKLYADPVVEIISCTRIDNTFGGGLGSSAKVYGSPTVLVNQIPGVHAGHIDADGNGIADGNKNALGTIGYIFGGGSEAQVIGNTNVEICASQATQKHISGSSEIQATNYNVGANISGNVYGGGNQADVTGSTQVIIGQQ